MTTRGLMAKVVLSSAAPRISISPLDSPRGRTSLSTPQRDDDRVHSQRVTRLRPGGPSPFSRFLAHTVIPAPGRVVEHTFGHPRTCAGAFRQVSGQSSEGRLDVVAQA